MRWYAGLTLMGLVGSWAMFAPAEAGTMADKLLFLSFLTIFIASLGGLCDEAAKRLRLVRSRG